MPRTVDLFLDSDQPLDRVAERLGELSSTPFVSSPDRAYFVAARRRCGRPSHRSRLSRRRRPSPERVPLRPVGIGEPGFFDRRQPGTGLPAPGQRRLAPRRGLCFVARDRPRAPGHGPDGRPVSRGRPASSAFPTPGVGPAPGHIAPAPEPSEWLVRPGPSWPCRHHGAAGSFDESERRASHDELAAAQILAAEGHQVRTVAERRGARTADLTACGTSVEVKGFRTLEATRPASSGRAERGQQDARRPRPGRGRYGPRR